MRIIYNTNNDIKEWFCPVCGGDDSEVISTYYDDNGGMEEQMECENCGIQWSNNYNRALYNQVILEEGD